MSYVLLSPLLWTVLLAIVAVVRWRRMARATRVATALVGALLLSLWTPLGANALQRGLESLTPDTAYCAPADRGPIVLLSGGVERAPQTDTDYAAFTLETWTRLRMATDLWHAQGSGTLWIVGGGPYAIKESTLQANAAADWQVPRATLRVETASTTTWQGAFAFAQLLPGASVRLVTSPSHRARTLFAFQAAGLHPCIHARQSTVVPFAGPGYLLPQLSALEKTENAAYELVGLLYYRIRARFMPEMPAAGAASAGHQVSAAPR